MRAMPWGMNNDLLCAWVIAAQILKLALDTANGKLRTVPLLLYH